MSLKVATAHVSLYVCRNRTPRNHSQFLLELCHKYPRKESLTHPLGSKYKKEQLPILSNIFTISNKLSLRKVFISVLVYNNIFWFLQYHLEANKTTLKVHYKTPLGKRWGMKRIMLKNERSSHYSGLNNSIIPVCPLQL